MIRSAVGPEPRSKADPTAVGAPAALLDWSRRAEPRPRTRFFRAFRSEPAFASVFFVCLEMGTGVEPPDPGVPLVWELLLLPPPPPVGLPPPPVWTHSL